MNEAIPRVVPQPKQSLEPLHHHFLSIPTNPITLQGIECLDCHHLLSTVNLPLIPLYKLRSLALFEISLSRGRQSFLTCVIASAKSLC
jgi:hypothetical protein